MSKDYLSNAEEVKDFAHKYKFLYCILSGIFVVFLCRLWYLQIFQGQSLRLWSERNHIKPQKLFAPRGMILDRQGHILVDNRPGFDVVITPQYAKRLDVTAQEIAEILNLEALDIIQKVKTSSRKEGAFKSVVIKEDLNRNEVARIERMRKYHPGLKIEMRIKRTYLMEENGAQLFGYVGEVTKEQIQKSNQSFFNSTDKNLNQGDSIGRSGLEAHFDTHLRGVSGMGFVQVDVSGREFKSVEIPKILSLLNFFQEPQPGHTLLLTLDKDIQEVAHQAFVDTGRIGAVVALENRTGQIVAWVNSPSFNPSLFWPKIKAQDWQNLINDPLEPLRNKVIQDHHPPGSTFKVVIALAALQEGLVDLEQPYTCRGFFRLGNRQFYCGSRHGHGPLDLIEAIAQSCNVFFYKLGKDLGIQRIAKYARALGIGQKTEINLEGEVAGLMPDAIWKEKTKKTPWQLGETLNVAIGQGFVLTSPLQLANVFAGIANGGPVYKPYLVDKVLNANGQAIEEAKPQLLRDPSKGLNTDVVISKKNYRLLQRGLLSVIHGQKGTARGYQIPGVEMAGKSGTVQVKKMKASQLFNKCEDLPVLQRHHGWFVGYAPFDRPQITVAVFAQNACSGSRGAAPVFREIVKTYLQKNPHLLENRSSQQQALKRKSDQQQGG